jgi:hypothetical protein
MIGDPGGNAVKHTRRHKQFLRAQPRAQVRSLSLGHAHPPSTFRLGGHRV